MSSEINEFMSVELKNWLDESIPLLPNDVEQVEETGYMVSVYWHERTSGTEAEILAFLDKCINLPLHEPSSIDTEAFDD